MRKRLALIALSASVLLLASCASTDGGWFIAVEKDDMRLEVGRNYTGKRVVPAK